MQISAYSRYSDTSAGPAHARRGLRPAGDDGALIARVGERTGEERRKAPDRRRPYPAAGDGDGASKVVSVPFAASARRDANVETVRVAPPLTTNLWSLIDAVESGGAPGAWPEPAVATPQKSSAESLYLLLAQVIAEG